VVERKKNFNGRFLTYKRGGGVVGSLMREGGSTAATTKKEKEGGCVSLAEGSDNE